MNKNLTVSIAKFGISLFTGVMMGKAALPSIKRAFKLPCPTEVIMDFDDIPEEELYDEDEQ